MTIFHKYFVEIKNRFILLIIAWCFTIITCYVYKESLLFLLIYANKHIFNTDYFYFITTNITDVFSTYIIIIYFVANQITIIYAVYNFIIFLSPGLYKIEYMKLKSYLKIIFIIIIFNCIITHYFFIPTFWKFFSSFQTQNSCISIFFEAKLIEYFEFYILIYYTNIILSCFYFFLFFFINSLKNKLTTVRKIKKITFILCYLISTLITPPDVTSQLLLGSLLFLFTELMMAVLIFKHIIEIYTNQ